MDVIWSFPTAPTSLYDGPFLKHEGSRRFALRFSFENQAGEIEAKGFVFEDVWAYRCDFLYAIRRQIMSMSYGRLVKLGRHDWLEEIGYQEGQYGSSSKSLSVFVITFDDGPSYQFLCEQAHVVD